MRFTRPGARTSIGRTLLGIALVEWRQLFRRTDDTEGMTRFQRTIALAKASWAVLKGDRSLALFPILSSVASVAIVAVLALLGWVTKGSTTNAAGHTEYSANAATIVIAAI